MVLTHEADGRCVAFFVDRADTATPIPLVMDERMYSDTVIRVIRISPDVCVAYDLRWLNGTNLMETHSYSKRRAVLDELIGMLHVPVLTALLTLDEVPPLTSIRGWETYDESPGTPGVFLPAEE
jgi:hypothetical protein